MPHQHHRHGKFTFSKQLAEALRIPCVELDALYWEPNWKEAEDEVFFAKGEYPQIELLRLRSPRAASSYLKTRAAVPVA